MMQKNKLVSIIIPAYNRMPLFTKCLRSVIAQDYPEIEIIVIDDASTQNVRDYLSKNNSKYLKKVNLFRNKINLGPSVSRNEGIKKATGEYFIFLDSDDIMHPTFVNDMVKKIEASEFKIYTSLLKPNFIDKVRPFYIMINLVRSFCFYASYIFNNGELPRQYFYMTRLSGMIFDKKAIKNILFDSSYTAAEDWKFVSDCLYKNKSRIGILPKSLVVFNYNSESLTLGRSNYFKSYKLLLKSLPNNSKDSFGIKLFQMYTTYVNNKNG